MNDNHLNDMRARSDEFIVNVLQQANHYSEEFLSAAKQIFDERNLGSAEKLKQLQELPGIKKQVYQDVQAGVPPEQVMQYMLSMGLDEAHAKQIASEAVSRVRKEEPEGSKSKGNIIFLILAIIAIVKLLFFFLK